MSVAGGEADISDFHCYREQFNERAKGALNSPTKKRAKLWLNIYTWRTRDVRRLSKSAVFCGVWVQKLVI
jgi:hypothetical protein